jgi:ribosomal-protein-alanine acetyltransferase
MSTPPAITLRRARPADAPAIGRLETAAFTGDRLSPRSIRHALTQGRSACVIAEAEGVAAGYALVLLRRGSARARLYSLAVDPKRRGLGIGRALLLAAGRAAAAAGAARLGLEVRVDNPAAIALYRSAGFAESGRRPGYYEDGAEAVTMERALTGPFASIP